MHGYWTHIGNVGGPTLHVILAFASIMTINLYEVLLRISMCVFRIVRKERGTVRK